MAKSFSNPLHPALVHIPIAFLLTSQLLDLAYTFTLSPYALDLIPTGSAYDLKPHLGDMARISHAANFVGAALGLLAILSGAVDLMALLNRQAVADKLAAADNTVKGKAKAAQGMHPKVKLAFLHAILMDLTVGSMGYGYYVRKDNTLGAPDQTNALIALGSLATLGLGSFLGGRLVYRHGVGVYSAGSLQKKDQ